HPGGQRLLAEWATSPNVTTQIGTGTGTVAMPTFSTIGSLSLTTASGLGQTPDSTRGITCRITQTTTTRTITTLTISPTITRSPLITVSQRLMPRSKPSRLSSLSWAITTVQSTAFSDRQRVTQWRIIRSPTS